MIRRLTGVAMMSGLLWGIGTARAQLTIVDGGRARADIVVDTRGAAGNMANVLNEAGNWLAEAIDQATGVKPTVRGSVGERPAVVVARADQYPEAARQAGLDSHAFDAYAIVTEPRRVLLLGASEPATQHAVAHLLHHWGFRYFNPMPAWWIVPHMDTLSVELNIAEAPKLASRRIWYAYGVREPLLKQGYERWALAARLSNGGRFHTGHSYGHIIGRNAAAFEAHPEYFNLLENGERNTRAPINARKFCVSNEGLVQLVIEDRRRLLAEYRESNPYAFMVSVDPSDGEGTCHCEKCAAIGTTTDRVFQLANEVARALAAEEPPGWVGLYAYSSHRMPPTIRIEPNVYVQVAMGFNKTPYTLPQLIEKWAERVHSIGLREYYGVEAWDWGLPGRMRGARSAYHAEWIPYYAARNVNAINAETNANWGAQTLGLNVAAALMWDPDADVEAITDDYFTKAFGPAAAPMRRLQEKFDAAPPLRGATLLPAFCDIQEAYDATDDVSIRRRIVDMMSYAHYLIVFRQFQNMQAAEGERNDAYYGALKPLMQYAWQTRLRGMVHYYALARRLCNGLPKSDDRMDFYMFAKDPPPIWQTGGQLTDDEVVKLFEADIEALEADDDPLVVYSRYLEHVKVPGQDAGPSTVLRRYDEGAARVHRSGMTAYLAARDTTDVALRILPIDKQVTVTVKRRDDVIHEQVVPLGDKPVDVTFTLPKAGEYDLRISGSFVIWVDESTPLVYEQSMMCRAHLEYSGPHYFYVPRGTKELFVEPGARLSLHVPGEAKRRDITPADTEPGKAYAIIPVPEGADGTVWHTSNMTRGKFALLNVPPLLSFHRSTVIIPREVAEADGLVTADNR